MSGRPLGRTRRPGERQKKRYPVLCDQYVHRAVWEAKNGPIPAGMLVHHKNGNVKDNRLENLELMTTGEHTRLHRGMDEAETRPYAQREWLLARVEAGLTLKQIADEAGVARHTIHWHITRCGLRLLARRVALSNRLVKT